MSLILAGVRLIFPSFSQRLLSTKVPLSSLARQVGVDRELQSIVDGMTLHPGKRRAASQRKQRVAQDENATDSE